MTFSDLREELSYHSFTVGSVISHALALVAVCYFGYFAWNNMHGLPTHAQFMFGLLVILAGVIFFGLLWVTVFTSAHFLSEMIGESILPLLQLAIAIAIAVLAHIYLPSFLEGEILGVSENLILYLSAASIFGWVGWYGMG
jgi:magnesium-transporting ATPase (P-type)